MPHHRRNPLLRNEPAHNSYGATSSSSGLEAGTANRGPEETTDWFSSSTKQIIAGSAVLLSGGMKIAELIVTSALCAFVSGAMAPTNFSERQIDGYHPHGLFEPVRGMVYISWILIYMLQLDYIYMIGHTPTDEDPTVGTVDVHQLSRHSHKPFQGYAAARALASSKIYKFVSVHILLAVWQLFCVCSTPSRLSRLAIDMTAPYRSSNFPFFRSFQSV